MNDSHDLQVLIESQTPIIVIETHEERRAYELLEQLAGRSEAPLFTWTVTEGIRRRIRLQEKVADTAEPEKALRHLDATPQNGIYVLLDFHPYFANPVIVRLIKDIAHNYHKTARTLVFISHRLELPDELRRLSARVELSMPDLATVRALVKEEADLWARRNGDRVKAERNAHDLLVQQAAGLSYEDARRLIRQSIHDDGAITRDDVERVVRTKQQMLGAEGLLELDFDTARLADVGGLKHLKEWLARREAVFRSDRAPGLDPPKGILILGVQGGGKSLAAKAVAGSWGAPLLRLDLGALYNKYHGESERNLRETLKASDAMAPCVLWLDEIEKGIAGGGEDDGLSRRMLGTLLTWMAERKTRVFLVATANDIQALPPELLRKGRFDEIFFVDLPDAEARREIFAIHLRRRGHDPERFEPARAVAASEGFSGAEIEQAVVSALYHAHAVNQPLIAEHLLSELAQTRPLSVVMAERIAALRTWAAGRTVMAG